MLDRVRFPVRRLVPEIPGQDVRFPVPVHVRDGDALGAEVGVENNLLPMNLPPRGDCVQAPEGHQAGREEKANVR